MQPFSGVNRSQLQPTIKPNQTELPAALGVNAALRQFAFSEEKLRQVERGQKLLRELSFNPDITAESLVGNQIAHQLVSRSLFALAQDSNGKFGVPEELGILSRAMSADSDFGGTELFLASVGGTHSITQQQITKTDQQRIRSEITSFRDQWRKTQRTRSENSHQFQVSNRRSVADTEIPFAIVSQERVVSRVYERLDPQERLALRELLNATKEDGPWPECSLHRFKPSHLTQFKLGCAIVGRLLRNEIGLLPFVSTCFGVRWSQAERVLTSSAVTFEAPISQSNLEELQRGVATLHYDRATLEVYGPIDPRLIEWAHPKGLYDFGPIPNVAIVFVMLLPSGATYRLTVKESIPPSSSHDQPQQGNTAEDRRVIEDLRAYFFDAECRRYPAIFDKTNLPGLGSKHTHILSHPLEAEAGASIVKSVSAWYRGLGIRLREAGKRTRSVPYAIVSDPQVTEESAIASRLSHALSRIERLPRLPDRIAAVLSVPREREAFLRGATEWIHSFVASERLRESEELSSGRHTDRVARGYKGPIGGYPLPFERLVMDLLHQEGAYLIGDDRGKARNIIPWYGESAQHLTAQDIAVRLSQRAPQRVIEILYQKPGGHNACVVSNNPIETLARIQFRNVIRLGKWARNQLNKAEIDARRGKLGPYEQQAFVLLSQAAHQHADTIARAREALSNDRQNPELNRQLIRVATRAMQVAAEFDPKIFSRLLDRVIAIRDYEKVKFIYARGAVGPTRFAEEDPIHGRTTHSALLDGMGMYAGGQIAIVRHERVFSAFDDWEKWNASYKRELNPWRLAQLDDGTGHYRIPFSSLPYAKAVVFSELEAVGISCTGCRVEDAVAPGLRLSW